MSVEPVVASEWVIFFPALFQLQCAGNKKLESQPRVVPEPPGKHRLSGREGDGQTAEKRQPNV